MKTAHDFRKQRQVLLFVLGFILIACITSCATTGPKYSTAIPSIAALSKEQGRIIFYRPDTIFGAAMKPDIYVDGKKVGESIRGTAFYVDVTPGKHQVKVSAVMYPGETIIDIELQKNETIYVKTYMGGSAYAGRTNVEVVNSAQAKADGIGDLVFIAEPLK